MYHPGKPAPRRAAPSSTSPLHRRVGPASWISHRSAQTDSIRCCGLRFAEERKRDEEKRNAKPRKPSVHARPVDDSVPPSAIDRRPSASLHQAAPPATPLAPPTMALPPPSTSSEGVEWSSVPAAAEPPRADRRPSAYPESSSAPAAPMSERPPFPLLAAVTVAVVCTLERVPCVAFCTPYTVYSRAHFVFIRFACDLT